MANNPDVTFGIPDNRLERPGYVHRWYAYEPNAWENADGEDVWRWPKTNLITLAPLFDRTAAEAELSEWTCAGTNDNFVEVTGMFATGTGKAIHQTNPSATSMICTSDFTPEDNQPFGFDLWLMEVANTEWHLDLFFSQRFALRVLYDGTLQLWRNRARPDTDEAQDWQPVGVTEPLGQTWNRRLHITVYPTGAKTLMVWAAGYEPIQYIEKDPVETVTVVNEGDPDEAEYPTFTIAPKQPVVLQATAGAFYFAYRYMDFKPSGWVRWPAYSLPWEYDDAFEVEASVGVPRAGHDFSLDFTIQDADDADITSPPADPFIEFRPYLEITGGDGLFSPEVYWGELRIDPAVQVYTPPAPTWPMEIIDPGRLLSASTSAAREGRHVATVALQNRDGGVDDLRDALHLATEIEVGGTVVWRGYMTERDAAESGDAPHEVLTLSGKDPLDRLDVPMMDAYIGDGRRHEEYVEDLMKCCGLAAADYDIEVDPEERRLPQNIGLEEALFRPVDGRTALEMIKYIARVWSGWQLYPDMAGVLHYAPRDTTGAAVMELVGYETTDADTLKFYSLTNSRNEEGFYNLLVVVGMSDAGMPLVAAYLNADSVNDPADADFLGFERPLVVVDSTLRSQEDVEAALAFLVDYHAEIYEMVEVATAFDDALEIGDILTLDASEYQVRSIGRDWIRHGRMRVVARSVS